MLRHARALWGRWWWLPALPWLACVAALATLGTMRWDHAAVAAAVAASAYGSERSRRLLLHALPLLLIFVAYDALRYIRTAALAPIGVLGCRLRDAELALFGVRRGGHVLTPNELLAGLQHPALDLLCAVPYGGYLFVLVAHWLHLYRRDGAAARRFGWIALATHLLGFATYGLLPAAPPWYVHAHGCTIDLAAKNSPAALARVDAMLGVTYFRDLYSRGATVYGALPSLHVTYPLVGLFATFGPARAWSRALQLAYAALMMFAAIYLDHHWLIDVLLGAAYVTLAAAVVGWLSRFRPAQSLSGREIRDETTGPKRQSAMAFPPRSEPVRP
jgi:inositol phosphorylceramide synthase catalytic subunit